MALLVSRVDYKKAGPDIWQSLNSYVKKKHAKFGGFCSVRV